MLVIVSLLVESCLQGDVQEETDLQKLFSEGMLEEKPWTKTQKDCQPAQNQKVVQAVIFWLGGCLHLTLLYISTHAHP